MEEERDREQASRSEQRQELLGETQERDEVDEAEEPEDEEAGEPVARRLVSAAGRFDGARRVATLAAAAASVNEARELLEHDRRRVRRSMSPGALGVQGRARFPPFGRCATASASTRPATRATAVGATTPARQARGGSGGSCQASCGRCQELVNNVCVSKCGPGELCSPEGQCSCPPPFFSCGGRCRPAESAWRWHLLRVGGQLPCLRRR